MVILELKDAAYEAVFELLDKAKHSTKATKLTLCELEDAIYECYEASKEDEEIDEHDDEEIDMNLRRGRGYRNYRHDYYGMYDEDEDGVRSNMRRMSRRSGMRRRRDSMGRFM